MPLAMQASPTEAQRLGKGSGYRLLYLEIASLRSYTAAINPRFLLSALLAVSAVAAGNPPISEAQLTKLRDAVVEEKKGSFNPGCDLSIALGLPTSVKDPYQVKYGAMFHEDADKNERGFGYSKKVGDYMLQLKTQSHVKYLRVGADLKLVAGASYKIRSGDTPQPIPPTEAAALIDQELAFWAKYSGVK